MKKEEIEKLREQDPLKFRAVTKQFEYKLNAKEIELVLQLIVNDQDYQLWNKVSRGQELRELAGELSQVLTQGPKMSMPEPEEVANNWKHPKAKQKQEEDIEPEDISVEDIEGYDVDDEMLADL